MKKKSSNLKIESACECRTEERYNSFWTPYPTYLAKTETGTSHICCGKCDKVLTICRPRT